MGLCCGHRKIPMSEGEEGHSEGDPLQEACEDRGKRDIRLMDVVEKMQLKLHPVEQLHARGQSTVRLDLPRRDDADVANFLPRESCRDRVHVHHGHWIYGDLPVMDND